MKVFHHISFNTAFGAICLKYAPPGTLGRSISLRTLARHPYDGWQWLTRGVMPSWVINQIGTEEDR